MANDARSGTGRTYAEILRENALNPVNVLLVAISIVLALLGLLGDAAVTVVLVLVNVVVGVYQEGRAKQTLDRLSVLTRPTATILRDGVARVADQHEVVLGDALVVKLGDQLMLDGRVDRWRHGGRRVAAHRRAGPHPEVGRRRGLLGQRLRQRHRNLPRHARRERVVRQSPHVASTRNGRGADADPARRRARDARHDGCSSPSPPCPC